LIHKFITFVAHFVYGEKMSKQADVGDLVELLVTFRNAIDEFVNKIALQEAPETIESARIEMPQFTSQLYDSLPWVSFETKKGQTWYKFSTAEDCGSRNPIKKALIDACMSPEATIQVPTLIHGFGYWIFRDWLYRREMKEPK